MKTTYRLIGDLDRVLAEVPLPQAKNSNAPHECLLELDAAGLAKTKDQLRQLRDQTASWLLVPRSFKPQAFFFDMDATIVNEETLVEMAHLAGVGEVIERMTNEAMGGKLDFADSLRRRVALLSGKQAAIIDAVVAKLTFTNGIDTLMSELRKARLPTFLVSGGFVQMARALQVRFGLAGIHANTLGINGGELTGELLGTIVDAPEKKNFLIETCKKNGWAPENCVAVGDGANDIPMLQGAGLGIGYCPKSVVRAVVDGVVGDGDHRRLLALL
jgi:phosphoserine phosphatase